MSTQTANNGQPSADSYRRWPLLRMVVRVTVLTSLAVLAGFAWFLTQLRSAEEKPSRNADGIVVLTGGSSRVSDAMDLLAGGYGKRLLISGVNPVSRVNDISRSLPESERLLNCCVDLDRSAVNTRSNATETRRWAQERGFGSLIVVTSNYHMPRAMLELSHAMPKTDLIAYPVIGEKWRDEPWWTSGAGFRLLLSEYAKFLAAEARVQLAKLGVSADSEAAMLQPQEPRQPATAAAN